MARTATPVPESREVPVNEALIAQDFQAANQLAELTIHATTQASALAKELGYQGALTVGALEDEIRFYQRRSVEALLECGKRLLLLKQMTQHGEFEQRVEMLGFSYRTASRFMQAAQKISKSANLALLSREVKSASAFLELVTHDDDVLENLAEMDDIDRLSASELRKRLRDMKADREADQKLLENRNKQIEKLEREQERIAKMAPDEALAELQAAATRIAADALGAIQGGVRQALNKLHELPEGVLQPAFAAGLVGQLQAELNQLRSDFGLPDVAGAEATQLAAEVSEWAAKK
ncbi:hypothetical protein [Comamonas terrigena]|uniref:hypothetical protein n=1 Tax=Comamonas terrigena TaxID=32013 RepID=UPI0028A7234F|nr:hypothetical protein [Comamonas terrigena]